MPHSIAWRSFRLAFSRFAASPVHRVLAFCTVILVAFCLAAGDGQTLPPFLRALGLGVVLATAAICVPAVLHDRRDIARRDAALMIPWTILLIVLTKQSILIATARAFPLRDQLFRGWDEHLGIRLPVVMHWAAQHTLGRVASLSYVWLEPMIIGAVLLPVIFAKPLSVQRYIVANSVAIVLALPCVLLLPAVGPWVGWGFAPDVSQHAWDIGFRAVRAATATENNMVASVCLPSLHVFWAMASAQALWFLRWVRIPLVLLTTLIVASTLTTGWHYGVDVLAGFTLAITCMFVAHVVASAYAPVSLEVQPESAVPPAHDGEKAPVQEVIS